MKLFLLIIVAAVFASCSNTDAVPVIPPRYLFQIDYQAGFLNDSVIVSIDGKVLSSGRVTSDTLGFAASNLLSLLATNHTLHLSAISNHVKGTFDTTFVQPSQKLYCGISYVTNSAWQVQFSLQPFTYRPTF